MEDYGAVGDDRGQNLMPGIISESASGDNIVFQTRNLLEIPRI